MPVSGRIEESYRRRLEALPAETQRLLRLAAAEPVGDPVLMWRAAERLGIGTGAATPAAEAGLLEVGARVLFRHPLVRSAAYRSASLQERGGEDVDEVEEQLQRRDLALGTALPRQRDPHRRGPTRVTALPAEVGRFLNEPRRRRRN